MFCVSRPLSQATLAVIGLVTTEARLLSEEVRGDISSAPTSTNNADEKAALRQMLRRRDIERNLAVQARRAGDNDWYVIQFSDRARRITPPQIVGLGVYRTIGGVNAVEQRDYVIVQGRRAAAEAIDRFLAEGPESVHELPASGYLNATQFRKLWTFRVFRSRIEAQEFFALVAPRSQSPK